MAQTKLTYQDKTNQVPIVDREQQATAEDFNEIKTVVNTNSDDAESKGIVRFRVVNNTGATLSATIVIYASTSDANGVFNAVLANPAALDFYAGRLGYLPESIASGAEGWAYEKGYLPYSGTLSGITGPTYLGSFGGQLTSIKPASNVFYVGTITKAYVISPPTVGIICIDIKAQAQGAVSANPTFDTVRLSQAYTPTGSEPVGTILFNPGEFGLDYVIDAFGSVTISKEIWDYLTNLSGGTLTNGQVVSIIGATGNRQAMSLTDATDGTSASACVGMVTVPSINNNNSGRVTKKGPVRGLNTAGMVEGFPVYVSSTNPGVFTQTLPAANVYFIHVGIVTTAHAIEGVVDVDIRVNPSLAQLSLFNGAPLTTTGQLPVWNQEEGYHDFSHNINDYIPKTQNDLTKEPSGFSDPVNVIINYNPTNRTITLTGTTTAYWRGELISELVPGWVSEAHGVTAGAWFLYYNGTSFVWSQTPWGFELLQIAVVNSIFGIRESHGLMGHLEHEETHDTIGTYLKSGGDLSSYTLLSTTATERRPVVSSTIVKDEDVPSTLPALSNDLYTHHYLTGAGTSNFTLSAADIIPLSGNQPYYNQWNGAAWVQTLMSSNQYMAIWLIAMPVTADAASQEYRYIWVQGQSQGSLAVVQAQTTASLNLGDIENLSPEFVFIAKVIIRYTSGNWRWQSYEKLLGSKVGQVTIPGGSYLSSVETDDTMIGDGTVGNPLSASNAAVTYILVDDTNNGDTLLSGRAYRLNSGDGGFSILLPTSGGGNRVKAYIETSASNNITFNGNGTNIEGASTWVAGAAQSGNIYEFVYNANAGEWKVRQLDNEVTKVGTPLNNQVAVWTGDGTLEGAPTFTYNGTDLNMFDGAENLFRIQLNGGLDSVGLYAFGSLLLSAYDGVAIGNTAITSTYLSVRDFNPSLPQPILAEFRNAADDTLLRLSEDGSVHLETLSADESETHIVAVDNATGLLSKRSVASIVGDSISMTENTTVVKTLAMTVNDLYTLLNAIPRNLGGYILTIQFNDGDHVLTSLLILRGFYNGSIDLVAENELSTASTLQSTSITFPGVARIIIAGDADVRVSSLELITVVGAQTVPVSCYGHFTLKSIYNYHNHAASTSTTYAYYSDGVKIVSDYDTFTRGTTISYIAATLTSEANGFSLEIHNSEVSGTAFTAAAYGNAMADFGTTNAGYVATVAGGAIERTANDGAGGGTNKTDITAQSFTDIADTTARLNATLNRIGTVYYGLYTDGSGVPTVDNIKAGTGTGYVDGGTIAISTAGVSNYDDITGLTAETVYDTYLVGTDALGNDSDKTYEELTTEAVSIPQLSTPVLTVGTETYNTIPLTWPDIANESSYELQRSADGSTGWSTINSPVAGSTGYDDTGRDAETTYYYRLRGVGDGVNYLTSEWSTVVNGTTEAIPVLNAPVLTAGTPTATTIPFTFTDTNTSPNESSFEVQYEPTGTPGYTQGVLPAADATSGTQTGLTAEVEYHLRIRAVGDGVNTISSAWSNVITATTAAAASNMIANGSFANGDNWDFSNAQWTLGTGVAEYDNTANGALIQIAANMNANLQASTAYTLTFDVSVAPAYVIFINSGLGTVYVGINEYSVGSRSVNFTTESDIGDGGFAIFANSAGNSFAITNIVLNPT